MMFLIAIIMEDSVPFSIAVNNIFSSFTKKGLNFITFSVEGKIVSYTGTFSLGNAIISSFHDGFIIMLRLSNRYS